MLVRRIVSIAVLAAISVVLELVPFAQPASAVPGLSREEAQSADDSTDVKRVAAQCPAGTRVLGGGGFIEGPNNRVHFTRMQAIGYPNQFVVEARENGDWWGAWKVVAYAICGQQPAGLTYSTYGASPTNSDTYKTVYADCPAGMVAISYGFRIINGQGQVFLTGMGPAAGQNDIKVNANEAEDGLDDSWSVRAYPVCAYPLPGQELVWDTTGPDSRWNVVTVGCPRGKQVHGLGGIIVPSYGEVFHFSIAPHGDDLGWATSHAAEDVTGADHSYWFRVYAICAT